MLRVLTWTGKNLKQNENKLQIAKWLPLTWHEVQFVNEFVTTNTGDSTKGF